MSSVTKGVRLSKAGYSSPRWSTEIVDCGVPMSFDQYSRCAYGCVYCFSSFQKAVSSSVYFGEEIMAAPFKDLERIFKGLECPKSLAQFQPFVKQKLCLQWGGLADPFCPFEKKFKRGLKILRLLKEVDYPITFSTKGTWWTKDSRYTELFKGQRNWNVKVSIITIDEAKRAAAEPRVPSSKARLRAIERIAGWDCGGATLRLRPFIIGLSNPGHVDLIHAAGNAGATALSTEFMCIEDRSNLLRERLLELSKVVGYDVYNFYKKYSSSVGYLRLNRNVKRPFVDEMERACKDVGMRFYVSDAHFKERSHNSCCCGLPKDWNYFRGQGNEALQIAKRKGKVHWSDLSKHMDFAKKFLFRFASGLNTRNSEYRAKFWDHTLHDWLRHQWNHPKGAISPYRLFEGILVPDGVDKNGDVVYKYNRDRE